MANGERAFHIASLVNNLTDKLTILTNGKSDFKPEQLANIHDHKIDIIETAVAEVRHDNGYINTVVFDDGNKFEVEALYAAVPFIQHCTIPETLGCELTKGRYIKVDPFQKTTVTGVYACGDNAVMMRSVANAVYSGNITGAMVNKELVDGQF